MKLARRAAEEPQINLTSLIDVVFLLLIFFMVTTTFVRHSGLDLRLPEAGADSAAVADAPLDVVIDAGGQVYLRGRPLAPDGPSLREALAGAADGDFDQGLRIRADGRASHQSVVEVMDVAATLGFKQVDIATRRVDEGRK